MSGTEDGKHRYLKIGEIFNLRKDCKISIIIPVYNMSAFIKKALNSAVTQTYTNIEVIVVDDCSTDNSVDLINEFVKGDGRVKLIKLEENSSALIARKIGVMAATGDYVMFLDPDDELYPNACEVALRNILCKNVDILQFGVDIRWHGNTDPTRVAWLENFMKPVNRYVYGREILELCFKEKVLIWNLNNKIFTLDLCKKVFSNIKNRKIYRYNDFYAFFILAWFAQSYFGVNYKLYIWNDGVSSSSAVNKILNIEAYDRLFLSLSLIIPGLKDFLRSHDDEEHWKAILEGYEEGFIGESYSALLNFNSFLKRIICYKKLMKRYGYLRIAKFFPNFVKGCFFR